jgi:Copper amine oxidase N-terminal domain
MKRLIMVSLALLIFITSIQIPIYAQGISVFVYGDAVAFKSNPIVSDNRTLVPLREICNALDVDVVWDPKTQSITLTKDGVINILYINKKLASKQYQGQNLSITLDVPPKVVNNITFVPLRYISESFEIKVAWDQTTQTAYIGEYDVPGKGEYFDFRQLKNHEFEKYYEVYYKVEQTGTSISTKIETVPLRTLDENQLITIKLSDGTSVTLTRKDWYVYFNKLTGNGIITDILQDKYGELFQEWATLDSGIEPATLAERYINNKYIQNSTGSRFDLRDF